jgi:hypothetical protein
MLMAQMLESRGQVGATHMGTGFDAWYPGYVDYMPVFQNIAAYWTETALYRYATPHFYTIDDYPPNMRDLRPGSLYSSPWTGGWWRLRDAVDYMRTASIAVLDYAAKYREDVLYNRYQSGRDQIARYTSGPPYAYVIPQQQRDPMAPVELLRRLALHGIRIAQLEREARLDGMTWPRGTWVIPMQQEYAELVRQLFDVQTYPDLREFPDGPPEQPYDAAGWTLPLMMGIRVVEIVEPLSEDFAARLRFLETERPLVTEDNGGPAWIRPADAPFTAHPVAAAVMPVPGTVRGSGSRIALRPSQLETFRVIGQALAADRPVYFDGNQYIIDGVAPDSLTRWARDLGLDAERTNAAGTRVRGRIAIYQPWRASMDEGWTRWLLDTWNVPYTRLTNADVQAGGLRDRFDAILIASDPAALLLEGYETGSVPARYEGGLGAAGVRALESFIRAGGTLVCVNQCAEFAVEQFHLPVRNVLAGVNRRDFFASGSILEAVVDTTHKVMAGMPQRARVFFDRSPVFETLDGFNGHVLARFDETGSPLRSGYLLGEDRIAGHAAALDVALGNGHVVLLGFRPQWRGQPWGTFRTLFNALMPAEAASSN